MISPIFFLFVPVLFLFGYQSILEAKGINNPTLSISLFKTTILLDVALKLFLICVIQDLDAFSLVNIIALMAFVLYFYAKLSLEIPKTSLRKNKKFPQQTNYTLCAVKVIVLSSFSTLFNLFLLFAGWYFEDYIEILLFCFVMVGFIILYLVIATKALVRLERLKQPSVRSLHGLSKNNSPIVLLRSFKIDSNPTMDGKVFDETICENLDLTQNPIISLANPDEILPSGGSLKIQAKDSEWKEVVKEILKNCRAVILVEGLSEGLHWEISKLKEYLKPEQLYVMIPSKKYRELAWCYNDDAGTGLYSIMRNIYCYMNALTLGGKNTKKVLNSVWTDFSNKLNQFGIYTPQIFPGNNMLLRFDDKWNAMKIEHLTTTQGMLDYIISQTALLNRSNFDYPMLGQKIESYEVNGFLNEEEIAPFKRLVDKCNKIGRIIAVVLFMCFIVSVLF